MAKQAFSFEYQGFKFSRSSLTRTYSHAVLTQESSAADRLRLQRGIRDEWSRNLAYHTSVADRTNPLIRKYPEQYPQAKIDAEAEAAQAYLAAGLDGRLEKVLREFDDKTAMQHLSADGDTYFVCQGWCSRLDLAEKLAARFDCPTVVIDLAAQS